MLTLVPPIEIRPIQMLTCEEKGVGVGDGVWCLRINNT